MTTVDPRELHDLLQRGSRVLLIDVRTPIEYRQFRVRGAVNVPFHQLDQLRALVGPIDVGQSIYTICQRGVLSRKAAAQLQAAGHANAASVEGGIDGCMDAGLTTERDPGVVSLERQVRIAAGSLVLVGTILGATRSRPWLLLPAGIGAGLAYAGLSNTCGMARLLARMPWNQQSARPPRPQLEHRDAVGE